MRLMSFALTTKQFLDGTKTVTRRLGWQFLKPGDVVMGVRKAMGLRKGEKPERLGAVRIVDVRRERLRWIDQRDVAKEGFPEMTPQQFVAMFCEHMGGTGSQFVTRIEFEHTYVLAQAAPTTERVR